MVVVETHDYLLEVLQETAIHRLGFAFNSGNNFSILSLYSRLRTKKKKNLIRQIIIVLT